MCFVVRDSRSQEPYNSGDGGSDGGRGREQFLELFPNSFRVLKTSSLYDHTVIQTEVSTYKGSYINDVSVMGEEGLLNSRMFLDKGGGVCGT